jgi:hypothetical protein
MAAFIPGASPPLVNTAMRFIWLHLTSFLSSLLWRFKPMKL